MNYALLGLFVFNYQGFLGSILMMLSHGLVSSALFLCVGVLYDRYHTRTVYYIQGIVDFMPIFCLCFFFFILSNIGFPGTLSFVGEFLVFIGILKFNSFLCLFCCLGMILSTVYSIWLYNRLCFGFLKNYIYNYSDLSLREFLLFIPLAFFIIFLGICPAVISDLINFFILKQLYLIYI